MVAWMNAEALATTLRTGKATFFSRSRGTLWTKGETSGNTLWVSSVQRDCDGDTLLLRVRASGPSCHTGRPTCFFQALDERGETGPEMSLPEGSFLTQLESEIATRAAGSTAEKSYTKYLLAGAPERVCDKVKEEAAELCEALQGESDERVCSETADLLYHVLVGLRARDISLRAVIEVLAARSGVSGHVEKASRPSLAK